MRLESGQVLAGRYALLRKLGEGRTAEVWLARGRESDAELVLKVLRAELSSLPDERACFLDAARLQRDITHPNVLACTSVREDDPVLATFAFEGSSDLARLRGAPLRAILRALAEVAEGAGALHARGCVHRDIKTSNVLVADYGRAMLADFGLAARIGEPTAAPGGSPFTSSPEQLAGAPPAIADDVYAFGALAYELLAGYPPFYPDAAAARTDAMPQPLAGRRADVPPVLEELVTRCLARRAEDRPRDMNDVLEGLRRIPDTESQSGTPRALHAPPKLRAPGAGEAAIEPMWRRRVSAGPSASELRSQGFRRGLLVGTFIFLLVVAGIVFFALPGWVERHETAPVAQVPAAPAKAAPSKPVVSAPAVDTQAAAKRELEQKKAQEQRTAAELRAALAAGAAAIAAGDAAEARRQYGIASKIDPANAAARRGLERANTLDEVRTLLAQAAELERNGQLPAAETAWKKALALDLDTSAARDAIARVEAQRTASAFSAAVADALAAVSRRDYAGARAAYERAGRIRPGAPEAKEGLEQVQRALGDRTIEQHLASARTAEQQERWRDALAEYRAALAIDAKLLDGQRGVERVEPRVMLDAAFSSYLERPERLFSDGVRGAARATLAQAAAIPDPGPVLTRQVRDLQALLAAAETPVRLVIASDNQTDVVIYRVGRLGAFSRKDMELLPGRYTVVGTRAGFRDVRREITIMPGNVPPELVIRCEEKI
jgi:eukaryotic-like serine/threonine-protein kinase